MSESIKFTPEEMDAVKQIQQEYHNKTMQLGNLEVEKILIAQRQAQFEVLVEKVQSEFKQIQEKEKQLTDSLTAKYGQGKLNPQTGEFTPEQVSS